MSGQVFRPRERALETTFRSKWGAHKRSDNRALAIHAGRRSKRSSSSVKKEMASSVDCRSSDSRAR